MGLLLASEARADEMDIALSRLRVPGGTEGCEGALANGTTRDFCADDESWRDVMSQLAGSVAPPVLSPARSLGYGGFFIGVEGWVTPIDSEEDYWKLGTEGDDAAGIEGRNRFPDSTLVWSRVVARKGFPFGFELGTSFAHMFNSQLWALGLEVKWSLFEGFRDGLGGVVPDVAVRGMVNTVTGDSEFNLTVPSFDVTVSKPIVIAGSGVLTPFIAGQVYWVFADSELVDLTPTVNAFEECRPDPSATVVGENTTVRCTRNVATDPLPDGRSPGQDYNNNDIFAQIRAPRARAVIGFHARYEFFALAASFQFDFAKPGDMDDDIPSYIPRQWTLATSLGAQF